jgi:hypothetical protein
MSEDVGINTTTYTKVITYRIGASVAIEVGGGSTGNVVRTIPKAHRIVASSICLDGWGHTERSAK